MPLVRSIKTKINRVSIGYQSNTNRRTTQVTGKRTAENKCYAIAVIKLENR